MSYTSLVLFDIDKTLIHSTEGHKDAFSEAFRSVYGIPTEMDLVKHNGMTDQAIIYAVLTEAGLSETEIAAKIPECMQVMDAYYLTNCMRNKITPMDGVLELLAELKQHDVLMGLVTGNLEGIARAKMTQIGANDYFLVGGFGSDHISRAELVRIATKKAVETCGFVASDNVFLVGDTPKDIAAGIEAGVKTIGVAGGINSVADLTAAQADFVLISLLEKERFLEIVA